MGKSFISGELELLGENSNQLGIFFVVNWNFSGRNQTSLGGFQWKVTIEMESLSAYSACFVPNVVCLFRLLRADDLIFISNGDGLIAIPTNIGQHFIIKCAEVVHLLLEVSSFSEMDNCVSHAESQI